MKRIHSYAFAAALGVLATLSSAAHAGGNRPWLREYNPWVPDFILDARDAIQDWIATTSEESAAEAAETEAQTRVYFEQQFGGIATEREQEEEQCETEAHPEGVYCPGITDASEPSPERIPAGAMVPENSAPGAVRSTRD